MRRPDVPGLCNSWMVNGTTACTVGYKQRMSVSQGSVLYREWK